MPLFVTNFSAKQSLSSNDAAPIDSIELYCCGSYRQLKKAAWRSACSRTAPVVKRTPIESACQLFVPSNPPRKTPSLSNVTFSAHRLGAATNSNSPTSPQDSFTVP